MPGKDSAPEDQIEAAIRRGEFNNLRGAGKPLNLEGYLNEDPETRVGHRMLRANRVSLPWIEEMKEIDRDLQAARSRLSRSWQRRKNATHKPANPAHEDFSRRRWERDKEEFREQIQELNRRILTFNLKVPVLRFQRSRIDSDKLIREVSGSGENG